MMLPVQINEHLVVRVKDPATSAAGIHYWLSLRDERTNETLANAECILPWDLLPVAVDDADSEPLERAMARGFAAAVLELQNSTSA
jgi:hypothetical protein